MHAQSPDLAGFRIPDARRREPTRILNRDNRGHHIHPEPLLFINQRVQPSGFWGHITMQHGKVRPAIVFAAIERRTPELIKRVRKPAITASVQGYRNLS
jgi:hypothetical protein